MTNTRAVMTFGRFQPLTSAHEKIFARMADSQFSEDKWVFTSKTHDSKKNPLDFPTKIEALYSLLGLDYNILWAKDPFNSLKILGLLGYERVTLIAGSDRLSKYEDFKRYVNHPDPDKALPGITHLYIVSSGQRDEDEVSGTKMREFARVGSFEEFQKMSPVGLSLESIKTLYNGIRDGYGIHVNTT